MQDKIIREIPLIARYARHNEAADYRFREYLKGRLNLSNAALDTVVQEVTDEVWQQIDCTTCAHCCRTLQIMVDAKDIQRLAKRQGISVREFSTQYVAVDEDKTKHLRSSPCVFLGTDNRCTVYEDRPAACRDFPYLTTPNFRSRTLIMIENHGGMPHCVQCLAAVESPLQAPTPQIIFLGPVNLGSVQCTSSRTL